MENNSNLKSLYLTLFILGIIETVLAFFIGYIIAIPVFIIALIIKSKLPKDQPVPTGIKLMIIASSIHLLSFFFYTIFDFFMEIFFIGNNMAGIFFLIIPFFYVLITLAVFVLLIIGCIKVYGEYKNLENIVS
mgnify:CR=1 FL=1